MRARSVCLLLVLGLLCGCRSVDRLVFPDAGGRMGPNDFESWELRRDLERYGRGHCVSTLRDPWDEHW